VLEQQVTESSSRRSRGPRPAEPAAPPAAAPKEPVVAGTEDPDAKGW
jgi:hypothetical protein